LNSVAGTSPPSGPALARRGSAARRRLGDYAVPALLLAPALALLAWLLIYPAGEVFHLAFTRWSGFSSPASVGFENFSNLFHDKRFEEALTHSLLIVAVMPIWIGLPYGIAWALHSKIWGWRFFRFTFFLPVVLSPVVIGLYYGMVLKPEGPFNSLLRSIGLGGLAHEWLNDPSLTLAVVIAIIIWSTFGIGVLIFLAGLSSLDTDPINAARIDGASSWQVQRHVVFWQLLPVIEFWAVLVVILIFTAFFPLIYTLTGGGPGYHSYTVDFDMYQEAFAAGRLGYAAAIGVALLIVMAAIASLILAVLRRVRTA
jgi:ABC-type sugar transport system permease subunit